MTRKRAEQDVFFVGYVNTVPRPLAMFLLIVSAGLLIAMSAFALASRMTMDDPGNGRFQGGTGNTPLIGRMELRPYPVLRVPAQDGMPARTVMLSGQGKRGVMDGGLALDGQMVAARGGYIRRGDLTMLQIGGPPTKPRLAAVPEVEVYEPAAPIPLGRWRLTGEICDGKCYAGAMRPGRGLAHKACANLCLFGGVPPVFVSSAPVKGSNFFLLAGEDGNPLNDISPLVALFVEVEGNVERLDDLLVFKMDPETVKVLK